MAVPNKKMIWSDNDTATLLRMAIERKIFQKFDGKKLTTKQIYGDLSRQLLVQNIQATPEQCKIKIKNMKKVYQDRRRLMTRSGAGVLPEVPHQALLDELLGGRPSTLAADGEMALDFTSYQSHDTQEADNSDVWRDFDSITFRNGTQLPDQDDDATTVEMAPASRAALASTAAVLQPNVAVAGPSGLQRHHQQKTPVAMSRNTRRVTPYDVPPRCRSESDSSSRSGAGQSGGVQSMADDDAETVSSMESASLVSRTVPGPHRRGLGPNDGNVRDLAGVAGSEAATSESGSSNVGESQASGGGVGSRHTHHGLSQTPRAIRRRQRGQSDSLDRLVSLMETSMERDAANVAALQASEANVARSFNVLAEQGAQHLALTTQMVHALQRMLENGRQ